MANATKRGNVGTTPFGDYLTKRGAVSTAQVFYANSMIGLNSSGYADKMDDAAAKAFDGVLTSSNVEVLAGGSNGDVLLDVAQPRFITVAIAAAAAADVGKPVYAVDDQTVALTPGSYGNRVGTIAAVISATCVAVQCEYGRRRQTVQVLAADGAITIKEGVAFITKAGVAAVTLAAPVATVDDGKRLLVVSTTAQAHTLTQTTPGVNNGGAASDVGTFGAAIGNSIELVAYQGVWYTAGTPRGVTLA